MFKDKRGVIKEKCSEQRGIKERKRPKRKPTIVIDGSKSISGRLRVRKLSTGQGASIQELVTEMASTFEVSREVVLYALLAHSGNVWDACDFLDGKGTTSIWDHCEDIAMLDEGGDAMAELLTRHAQEEILARHAFLVRLCEFPSCPE